MESALEAGVELKKWGYQSSVYVLRHGGKTEKTLRGRGIPVLVKKRKCELPAIRNCFELALFLIRNNYPIIHCRCVEANFCGIVAAKMVGTKCLIEEVGSPQGRSKVANWLLSRLYSLADGVIFVSKTVKKEFQELNYKNKNIHVIYNPIKSEFFGSVSRRRKKPSARKTLRIISAFRIEAEKNPLIIPEIAAKLKKKFRWDIFGKGSLQRPLQKKIKACKLQSKIKLKGFHKIDPRLLSKYDVLVLPSFHEGMGIIVVEALAVGLSIVAASVGGIPELFKIRQLKKCLVKKIKPDAYAKKVAVSTSNVYAKLFYKNKTQLNKFHPTYYKEKLSAIYDKILAA